MYIEKIENGYSIKTYPNGLIDKSLISIPMETPIIPVAPQPTNQEVMDMQITVLDLVVTVLENQLLGGM